MDGSLTFRPLLRADLPLLRCWLAAEHVRRWWGKAAPSQEAMEAKYGPRIDGLAPTRMFIAEYDGQPAAMIQAYRHADYPDWDRDVAVPDAVGIDYLIGVPGLTGRGLGSRMLRAFSGMVLAEYPDAAVVVAVPQRDNRASCRALEKAGFRLIDERDLASDDPSDEGVSAIYGLRRNDQAPSREQVA